MSIEFKTARLKLTLVYILILLGIMFLTSFVSVSTQRSEVMRFRMEDGLQERQFRRAEKRFENLERGFQNRILMLNLFLLLPSAALAYFLSGLTLKPIENSLKQKDEFAGDVSHELRTPIQNIKLEIENIQAIKRPTPKDHGKFIKSVGEEADRIQGITESLLTMVRVDNSKVKSSTLKVKGLLEKSIENKRHLLINNRIKLITRISKNFTVYVVKEQLSTALSIILDNAIKYSPPKSSVLISAEINKTFKTIKIKDAGIGIKEENVDRVFESFFREDNITTRKVTGSGIGLHLVKKIAAKNNFSVNIKSRVGKGTEVSLVWKT